MGNEQDYFLKDCRVEVYDPFPSKGGQQVGAKRYGVKVTHLPTELVAMCHMHRQQHKNKTAAQNMVEYGLLGE